MWNQSISKQKQSDAAGAYDYKTPAVISPEEWLWQPREEYYMKKRSVTGPYLEICLKMDVDKLDSVAVTLGFDS